MREVVLALQASDAVHLGVDNLNVFREAGCLLDGDLTFLISKIFEQRESDTVRVTKVKGHADEKIVQVGRVLELDRLGTDAACEAADFGRRRVDPAVLDARRNLSVFVGVGIILFWICIVSSLPSPVRWLIMMI